MRDDFSQKTKDILAKRVGYICSNPKCRMSTVGPNSERTNNISIGVAAHISAASGGGPRYNPQFTQMQRQSIENGIWLCQSCSKLIDRDTSLYSVETLTKWRIDAENEASERLNKQMGNIKTITQNKVRELDKNGYYETTFHGQKLRFFVDCNDNLHLEHEPSDGIISYQVIDKNGKMQVHKWPYPLNEYEISIDQTLILNAKKEILPDGRIKEFYKLKWDNEAEIIKDSNGKLLYFHIKKDSVINHLDKKIWIDKPDFIVADLKS